jgi:hypothetical protein
MLICGTAVAFGLFFVRSKCAAFRPHKKETPREAGFPLGLWPGLFWLTPPQFGLSSEPEGSVLSHRSRV